jgi:leucine dehydrogenase
MQTSLTWEHLDTGTEHEEVVLCSDPAAGFRGVIAVHSTALGPAVGGTRLWRYRDDGEAVADALRLSRGMTFKCAVAGVPLGGGKAVVLQNGGAVADRPALFRALGRFVERFGGRYITAEDVGTTPADLEHVLQETRHVAGLADRSGDPSPATARGVVRALEAAALVRWGSPDLAGRTVALQGCGNVGAHLARELRARGARLVVTDLDRERARAVAAETGADLVDPEAIWDAAADVYAPCALGGVLNAATIPRLRVAIVTGAANNQLAEPADGDRLAERGILYAPDYVANAGGMLSGGRDLLGWSAEETAARIEGIHDTLLEVFRLAERDGVAPHTAADRLAAERLRKAPLAG